MSGNSGRKWRVWGGTSLVFATSVYCIAFQIPAQPLQDDAEHEVVYTGSYGRMAPTGAELRFAVPEPIEEVELSFTIDPDTGQLTGGKLIYGEMATVVLPSRLLSCLPAPMIGETSFSATTPLRFVDAEDRRPRYWWNLIRIYYGEAYYDFDNDAVVFSAYPVLELELLDFELQRAVFYRSPGDARVVEPVLNQCPQELIEWSLE